MPSQISITSVRHPDHLFSSGDWDKWRLIWEGGEEFTHRYLKQYSDRESVDDFQIRKSITPVPGFAKAALNDIKNSVFHRMGDISRKGGSKQYVKAIAGDNGGVDRRGSSMNHFIGTQVLPELLVMGKVGVYVDNTPVSGPTLAEAPSASPYLYTYRVEDILSWKCSRPEEESDFQAVLLRDWCIDYTAHIHGVSLPDKKFDRYRLVWIGEDGFVRYQFFNSNGDAITPFGELSDSEGTRLELRKIPFVMFDIGESLLKDISNHQIALLNLASADIAYALKSNFPFYTEQTDLRAAGSHLKGAVMEDGTSTSGGQAASQREIRVGATDGRMYGPGMDRPQFIAPPSEPLEASMKLQQRLEDSIRKLVNLAVVSLGNSRASGEARNIDNQGLESGLAFIGLVLETGERKLADHWSTYEGVDVSDIVIKYPDQYRLKSTIERLDEAEKLTNIMFSIPGASVKKELAKDAVTSLLGGRITPDKMTAIYKEIDVAEYSTSDPEVIRLAKEEGLASDITLSTALGFNGKTEIPKAERDHAKRIERIQQAQSSETDPAARGVRDLSANAEAGREERESSTNTDTKDTTKPRQRGRGRRVRK